MFMQHLQNLHTFPAFHQLGNNLRLAYGGTDSLFRMPAIKARDVKHFHANVGELCYSFLDCEGESPQRKWIAVFVYEEGYATHDGKVWVYAIFA